MLARVPHLICLSLLLVVGCNADSESEPSDSESSDSESPPSDPENELPWGVFGVQPQQSDFEGSPPSLQLLEATTPIDYGLSGSWYEPRTSGQGFNVEVLPALNQVVVYWFTYDTSTPSRQRWFVAQGPIRDDVASLTVFETSDGQFDEGIAVASPVGLASLGFSSCSSAEFAFDVPALGPEATIPLTRLTGSECGGPVPSPSAEHDPEGRTARIQPGHSGSYFKRETSGQGFNIEVLDDANRTVVMYWYTYEQGTGEPDWYTAIGTYDESGASAELTVYDTAGGLFNDPAPVQNLEVGTGTLTFDSCDRGVFRLARYFGETRDFELERLTPNVHCTNELSSSTTILDVGGTVSGLDSDAFGPFEVSGNVVDIDMEVLDDDADLYVAFGKRPTYTDFACAPREDDEITESCRIHVPQDVEQDMYILIESGKLFRDSRYQLTVNVKPFPDGEDALEGTLSADEDERVIGPLAANLGELTVELNETCGMGIELAVSDTFPSDPSEDLCPAYSGDRCSVSGEENLYVTLRGADSACYELLIDLDGSGGSDQLRLGDNSILEFYNDGEWRGVCDDGFGIDEATVACRELGGTLISYETEVSGPSGDFWIDGLSCDGSEDSITECTHNTFGDEDCFSGEHVRLYCDTGSDQLRLGDNSILEFYNDGEWRGVCDDGFGTDEATVACRELGGALISYETGMSGPSGDFWIDGLSCDGSEDSITECTHNTFGDEDCFSGEHVQLFCSIGGGQLRLGDNSILEFYNDGEWRGVCDDGFGTDEATVACRELGGTLISYETEVSGPSGDFWIDNLSCDGSEPSITECTHNAFGDENCFSGEHVSVECAF